MKNGLSPIALSLILIAAIGCRDSQPVAQRQQAQLPGSASPDIGAIPEDQLDHIVALFNRGIAMMDRYQPGQAVEAFDEVVRIAPNWTTGRLNLGIALLNMQDNEAFARAEQQLEQVLAAEPDNCHAHFSLGMLLTHLARFDEARPHFEHAVRIDPDDADAHYQLAVLIEGKDPAAARKHFERALEIMPHFESACYRLQRLLRLAGEKDQSQRLLSKFQSLKTTGAGVVSGMKYGEMGRYANVIRAFRGAELEKEPGSAPAYADVAERVGLTQPSTGRAGWPGVGSTGFGPGMAVADVDGDGDLDVYVPGGDTPTDEASDHSALYRNDGERFRIATDSGIDGRGAIGAFFGDYNADGAPDLFLTCNGPNRLYQNDGQGTFSDVTQTCGLTGAEYLSVGAAWADADHDGDLDLFIANYAVANRAADQPVGSPNTLWRNNGDGTFTDATVAATFGGESATVGATFLDVDDDRDLDLYVINHHAPNRLYLNQRTGRYVDATSRFEVLSNAEPGQGSEGLGAVRGDVDGNGLDDLLLVRGNRPPRIFLQRRHGVFAEDTVFAVLAEEIGGAVGALLGDLDLDGDLDLVLLGAGKDEQIVHQLMMNQGSGQFSAPTALGANMPLPDAHGAVAADLDGDGMLEILVARAGARPQLWRAAAPPEQHWLEVVPRMTGEGNENRIDPTADGLVCELKTGLRAQMSSIATSDGYLGGPPSRVHFGMGTRGQADYLRLAWSDGVLQSELEVAADQLLRVSKVQRKPSSCPVLFSWDGERFAYVTDFLGVGGLGFFLSPGQYGPPDSTEDVRIPPELIEARDGHYLLRVSEPLEEVTYIDQLHLIAYDHPTEWEVFPDERFASMPPMPTAKPYAVGQRIYPLAAKDHHANDVLPLLLEVDRRFVEPPADPRFIGYAEDHWVELDFGDQLRRVRPDAHLVLYLYGWVEYTFSHVNYAAWQAGVAMQSPSIEVPDGNGLWRTVVEDAGYPAGLPRMMTLDVSTLPIRAGGRMRIRSNMEIFWDQIFLAEDVAAESVANREGTNVPSRSKKILASILTPSSAKLRPLGYPREYSPDGVNPTLYDYHRLDRGIAFKNMTGDYTRFGEVGPLLRDVDDQFAILGRGDEIALEFPADQLPALPTGWSRTLVLHCDGYCKDMDLYTAAPDTVGPLPFHGMKNYPPEQSRREDPDYDRYRSRWNTRRVSGR